MPRKDKISKKKSIVILLSFVVLVLLIFALLFSGNSHQQEETITDNPENLEFTIVENPDTSKYLTVICPINAVDILAVSTHFYQHEEYWSYIYRDNKLDDLLNIPAGSVIRIPRIDSVGAENSLASAKLLGDILLKKQFSKKDN